MSDTWTQYTVACSDGEGYEYVYDSLFQAERELERVNAVIASDPTLSHITAKIVTREVEAGDWSK